MAISKYTAKFIFAALLSLPGCATLDSLEPGEGTNFQVRGKSYDEVWNAALTTAERRLTVVESNKDTGTVRAENGVGLTTWGEVVGIFIRPSQPGAPVYTIEVQSEKRYQIQLTGEDWTTALIDGIKSELNHGYSP